MRVPFDKIFFEVDGHLIPRRHIGIANISISAGVAVPKSLRISGIEIGKLVDHDLMIEMEEGITMIEGYHPDNEPPPPA